MTVFDDLIAYGAIVSLTGSRAIGGVTEASDWDYLVEIHRPFDFAKYGFVAEGEARYEGQEYLFTSYRHNQINLLVTNDVDFAKRHRAATFIAKHLHLTDKADRIMVFKAVLYGEI